MRQDSKLLIDEPALQVLPTLALRIGLNEAIVLQQLHYWLRGRKHQHFGRWWVYNSIAQWHEQFPFWSEKTIRRTLDSLKATGVLLCANLGEDRRDRTLWYSIDYDRLAAIQDAAEATGQSDQMHLPQGQNDQMQADEAPAASGHNDHLVQQHETTAPENNNTRGDVVVAHNPLERMVPITPMLPEDKD